MSVTVISNEITPLFKKNVTMLKSTKVNICFVYEMKNNQGLDILFKNLDLIKSMNLHNNTTIVVVYNSSVFNNFSAENSVFLLQKEKFEKVHMLDLNNMEMKDIPKETMNSTLVFESLLNTIFTKDTDYVYLNSSGDVLILMNNTCVKLGNIKIESIRILLNKLKSNNYYR